MRLSTLVILMNHSTVRIVPLGLSHDHDQVSRPETVFGSSFPIQVILPTKAGVEAARAFPQSLPPIPRGLRAHERSLPTKQGFIE